MNKAKKAYLQGLKDAQVIIKKEYEREKKDNPGNLDGFTFGWFSGAILNAIAKKTRK